VAHISTPPKFNLVYRITCTKDCDFTETIPGHWLNSKTYVGEMQIFKHGDECNKEWLRLHTPWYLLEEFGGNI